MPGLPREMQLSGMSVQYLSPGFAYTGLYQVFPARYNSQGYSVLAISGIRLNWTQPGLPREMQQSSLSVQWLSPGFA
ncbi:hypothetical protein ACOSQ3_032540 [Xanthoceras sorbifolium]